MVSNAADKSSRTTMTDSLLFNDCKISFCNLNKTPAKAFTPPAEKKMGTRWSFVKKSKRVTGLYLKMLFTSSLKVKRYAIIQ